MKAGWLGLAIERWGTFRLTLRYQQPDGTPVDLTGCEARLRIWRQAGDETPLLDLEGVLDGPAGLLAFGQTLEELAGVEAREGVHAITITDALGDVTALADGPVDFLQPGARPPRRAPGAYPATAPTGGGAAIVVLSATEVRIVAVAMQGPAGTSGEAAVLTYPAAAALGGHRWVVLASGACVYADSGNPDHAGRVLGMTTGAAVEGADARIQTGGTFVEPSWTWIPDQPLYLGAAGQMSQMAPASGFVQELGVALSATTVFIRVGPPILT